MPMMGTVTTVLDSPNPDDVTPMQRWLLTIAAALMWACGNIVTRTVGRYGPMNQLAFVVWASLVPPLPLLALIRPLPHQRKYRWLVRFAWTARDCLRLLANACA